MKISIHNRRQRSEQGGLLLVTMGFGFFCGITLASYYILADQEHREVLRSQSWNASLAMAEAGVDEAFAQINATNISAGNFSPNGWGGSGANYGPVTRTRAGGSYSVSIVGGAIPTIYATGFVAVADTGQIVSRRVQVTASVSPVSPFSVGIAAAGSINFTGNGVVADSWNSETNTQSNNGQWNGYAGTNGSMASEGGIVNLGNHTVDGNLYLGPTATYSGGGTVTGTIYNDYNVQFPDVTLPTSDTNGNAVTWQTPTEVSGAYNFTNSNNNGYYVISNSDNITVAAGITVTLQVTTPTFAPAGITILGGTTNSGSIVMYQDSGSITLNGSAAGGAINGRPENFLYFGLPGVTSITFGGSSTFIGAIYAPEANLTLNGGGSGNNIEGSVIVGSITDHGHFAIHYDTSLATLINIPGRGYIPISWQEF